MKATAATITRPRRFPGTADEAKANWATHRFTGMDDIRCFDCDCRPSITGAGAYPCGTKVPRQTIVHIEILEDA